MVSPSCPFIICCRTKIAGAGEVELATNLREVFTIREKAPTRAFSWLREATTASTFKNLLRHFAKLALIQIHNKNSVLYMKVLVGAFNKPGEGPGSNFFRDCEILAKVRSELQRASRGGAVVGTWKM